MSLLTALGLPALTDAEPVAASPGPQAPQGEGPSRGKVDVGEPTVKPRRTRMTSITVAGRKLDLWGLVDKDGAVAQSGGKPPLDLLTSINRAAIELWKTNETTLLVRVPMWRKAVADVRATTTKAAGEFKKAEAMVRGMKDRRDKGGDFFEDVNGYLKALAEVKALGGAIQSAQLGYEKSLAELESKIGLKGFEEGKDDVEKKKEELDAKKAELAEAQAIFGKVLEIGKKVLSADWKGLADQAVGYIKDKAEEAVRDAILGKLFDVDIKRLTEALDEAKRKTAAAKAKWLEKAVEAATLGMRQAATDFDNARGKLRAALADLARNQGNAVGALKRNESTRPLGQLIEQRGGQLAADRQGARGRAQLREGGRLGGHAGQVAAPAVRATVDRDRPPQGRCGLPQRLGLGQGGPRGGRHQRRPDGPRGRRGRGAAGRGERGARPIWAAMREAGPMGPYNKAIETIDKALQDRAADALNLAGPGSSFAGSRSGGAYEKTRSVARNRDRLALSDQGRAEETLGGRAGSARSEREHHKGVTAAAASRPCKSVIRPTASRADRSWNVAIGSGVQRGHHVPADRARRPASYALRGFAFPIGRPSTFVTGVTPPSVPVTNASSAEYTCASVKSHSRATPPAAVQASITFRCVIPLNE